VEKIIDKEVPILEATMKIIHIWFFWVS
jgi:hypothetical protein